MTYLPVGVAAADDVWERTFFPEANKINVAREKLDAMWAKSGLKDDKLPVQFVIDLLTNLYKTVVAPWSAQQKQLMEQHYFARDVLAQMGASTLTRYWPKQLAVVLSDAKKARAAGKQFMAVKVPDTRMSLRGVISLCMIDVADDIKEAQRQIADQRWLAKTLEGSWLLKGMVAFSDGAQKVFDAAATVARETVDIVGAVTTGAVDLTRKLVWATVLGGGAYLAWRASKR